MRPGALLRLLPPLGWTALIAWLSTSAGSAATTETVVLPLLRALAPGATPEQLLALHWLLRKAGHLIGYGGLAVCWRWALGRTGWALSLVTLTAALDELHQVGVLGREGQVTDVLLDVGGAGAALLLLGPPPTVLARLTTLLLWAAAAGGTGLLVLHAATGAPAGWLWLSAAAGWIALLAWRRRRER